MQVRLQKILSQAGVTSRRKAEEFIRQGRVRVNGKVVYELGSKADPDRDEIHFDGKKIEPKQPRISVLLNKPDGYITSLHDPEGRPTVAKLVDNLPVRLYPVGRLDYHTEGLLILTNDGELAQKIEHPSHSIEKVYLAKVKGIPHPNEIKKLRQGIDLEGRKTLPARIRVVETRKNAWIEVVIREGRQNQIRKMFDAIEHPVIKLKRVAIGSLRDDSLKPGEYRMLKTSEIKKLLEDTSAKKRTQS
jgi:23S rRNA pseudouridine2605 synthase